MTDELEPRRSRPGLATVVVGLIIAALASIAVAVAVRLQRRAEMRIAMSITIDRPVSEVFAFVADARNVLEWLPAAVERRKVSPGPIGIGTRFESTDRIGQRTVSHTQEIIDFEKDQLVRWQISAPWDGTYDIRTERVGEGTLLSVDTIARPSGMYRLLVLVPASVMRSQFEQDYARLKDLLEGRGVPWTLADAGAIEVDTPTAPASIPIESDGASVSKVSGEAATT